MDSFQRGSEPWHKSCISNQYKFDRYYFHRCKTGGRGPGGLQCRVIPPLCIVNCPDCLLLCSLPLVDIQRCYFRCCIRCRLYTEHNREGHPLPKVPGSQRSFAATAKKLHFWQWRASLAGLESFGQCALCGLGLCGVGGLCVVGARHGGVWVTDAGRLYQTLAIPSHPSASPKGSRGASQRSVRPRFMGQILPQSAPAFSHEGGWG